MIAADTAVIASALALVGTLVAGLLTYRAVSRQTRNAERNTDIDQVRLANESMGREIERLTRSEESCQKRLAISEAKVQRLEERAEENREEMREMRAEILEQRVKIADLVARLGPKP